MKYEVVKKCIVEGHDYGVGKTVELYNHDVADRLMENGYIVPHGTSPKVHNKSVDVKKDNVKTRSNDG